MFNSRERDVVDAIVTHEHKFSVLTDHYAWCLDCGALRMSSSGTSTTNEPSLVRIARKVRA